jgi:transmembrane sensor
MGPRVLVTLIEGHVVVVPDPPKVASARTVRPAPIQLDAGEQLVATASAPPQVTQASLERATAWETGQLAFKDEPLGAVAERVSRYARQPIHVAPDAAQLRVSGVFKAGDIDTFVDIVTSYLPVRADKADDGEILLQVKG